MSNILRIGSFEIPPISRLDVLNILVSYSSKLIIPDESIWGPVIFAHCNAAYIKFLLSPPEGLTELHITDLQKEHFMIHGGPENCMTFNLHTFRSLQPYSFRK